MGESKLTAIILAGGMGTRLQSVVSDVPKPMAAINNRPFLEYLLAYLKRYGISEIVLSTGYMGSVIKDYFGDSFLRIPIIYSYERLPLGTGGAIKLALEKCGGGNAFVLNGDTFFDVDLLRLSDSHTGQNADITISLKMMCDIDRYGIVELNAGKIITMREKGYAEQGHINGGVYCLKSDIFDGFDMPESFSFERFLADGVSKLNIRGFVSEGDFIDIGIPEDYVLSQTLMPKCVRL